MISRRDKLLKYPWEQQRYEQHKARIRSAKPAIDARTPPAYAHVTVKLKKVQNEQERRRQIEAENVRLLQKLGVIMSMNRLPNFWVQPRPNFLQREKLFEIRPQSSLPKLIAIYAPAGGGQQETNKPRVADSRCPTCSGRPEYRIVQIPEPRIPWEPSRKSWNAKVEAGILRHTPKCRLCVHAKVAT